MRALLTDVGLIHKVERWELKFTTDQGMCAQVVPVLKPSVVVPTCEKTPFSLFFLVSSSCLLPCYRARSGLMR